MASAKSFVFVRRDAIVSDRDIGVEKRGARSGLVSRVL